MCINLLLWIRVNIEAVFKSKLWSVLDTCRESALLKIPNILSLFPVSKLSKKGKELLV